MANDFEWGWWPLIRLCLGTILFYGGGWIIYDDSRCAGRWWKGLGGSALFLGLSLLIIRAGW